ncbi:glycoside hydrolase [Byssothecium circinans]|uniref:Glycoside hydrolase n=1 Tax=Byssothecium circinans TaxID=147558 RepID=A0A6A5T8S3_9PLEO|nr:glycoside hydrolase [Byssothecium circinans]
MRNSAIVLGALTAILDTASAHGFVTGIQAGSTWTKGADPVWFYSPSNSRPQTAGWDSLNQDLGFVEPNNLGTSDINCHKSATAGRLYATVAAGQTIQIPWNTWPSDSHKGPIINYIAPCNGDCTTLTPGALRWSKISAAGLSNGKWPTDPLPTNNFTSSLTIPSKLKAGNYVLRHEIIALHGAQNDNGAQLYPQCINLQVTGGGSVSPTNGVAGAALYKKDDAGIKYNLYTGQTTYPIPGPALWTAAN